MIEGINEEERLEVLNSLQTRAVFTEKTMRQMMEGNNVTIGPNEVANLLLQSVLNQLSIMRTLRSLLITDAELEVERQRIASEGRENN